MPFLVFFHLLLALTHAGARTEWQPLDSCIQRLKAFEQEVVQSAPLKAIVPLDRRLNFMIEGIRYAEMNSERLKGFVDSDRSDRLAPYLVANATVACERDEVRIAHYLGGLKRFLVLFFVTTLSLSAYGSYLFAKLTRAEPHDR